MKLQKLKASWLARGVFLSLIFLFLCSLALYGLLYSQYYLATVAAVVAIVGVVVTLMVSFRIIHNISASVLEITYVAQQISAGSFGIQATRRDDGETGKLVDSVNEMSAKLAITESIQTEFISSISHELRTPLTAITGWSETMQFDDAISGDSRRGLVIIAKETARLSKMVEDLLEFTRIQDGRFNLSVSSIDIGAELEDAIFTYRELLRQDGIELIYNPDFDELPEIIADPERLRQVFLNILDNAAKYGRESGKIDVALSQTADFIVISVHNYGAHIPENELAHVKERFYKGSSKERGSGIGLAVCDEIILKHSGSLEIANTDDGVVVTIKLPLNAENVNA